MNFLTKFLKTHFYLITLMGVLLWGFILRIQFMDVPIRYDEAFTYLRYAHLPLNESLSDYEFPNNHLLHTILVHFSTGIFGGAEWAIRLPSFLAGLASIWALYALFQSLYDEQTGLVAAMLMASVGMIVEYSTDARGYMLGTLLFLLMLRRPTWWTIGLLGAAAIYTVPTMLYGFAMMMVWWLAEIWRSEENKKPHFIKWFGAGVLAAVLSFLLYLPILLTDGLDMILNNPIIVKPNPEQFRAEFPQTLAETFQRWHSEIPWPIAILLGIGFLASMFAPSEKSKIWLPVTSLVILPMVIFQQVLPFPRVWLFLLPIYLGFSALGWVSLLKKMPQFSPLILGGLISLILGLQILGQDNLYHVDEVAVLPQAETIRADLLTRLNDDSRLVVVLPSEIILEYYFERHQTRDFYLQQTRPHFSNTLYILVNHDFENQMISDVFGGMAGYSEPYLIQEFEGASLYQSDWIGAADNLEVQIVMDWRDQDGLIFNPRTNPNDLMSFIGMAKTSFSEDEAPLIEQWRNSKESRFLRQVGIQYLLVDGEWLSWLSEAEFNQLADTTQYETLREWRNDATGEFFRLYQVN